METCVLELLFCHKNTMPAAEIREWKPGFMTIITPIITITPHMFVTLQSVKKTYINAPINMFKQKNNKFMVIRDN